MNGLMPFLPPPNRFFFFMQNSFTFACGKTLNYQLIIYHAIMKTKFLYGVITLLMCVFTCVSCSSDDDNGGGGLLGTYGSTPVYTNGHTFRYIIVITKSSFKRYQTAAVQDKNYYSSYSMQVPEANGWYTEKGSTVVNSYVASGNNIVLNNGDLGNFSDGRLVMYGRTYTKMK